MIYLSRLIAIFLFTAILAGNWDVWWHGAVGRDTFWEPPHILMYSAVTVALVLGLYGWKKFHEKVWRNAALALLFIPAAAPVDELWHRLFGVERVDSLFILWSPAHLLIVAAFITAFSFLLPLLRQDPSEDARRFMGAFMWAAIISLISFLAGPFNPFGPFKLLGFWGPALLSFVLVWPLLKAQKWLGGFASASFVTVILIAITSFTFGEKIAPGVPIIPHDHSPGFLVVFSYLAGSAVVDFLIKKPRYIRGALYGLLWGGIVFGFSSPFFEPAFQYSTASGLQAIVASIAGGLIAGLLP